MAKNRAKQRADQVYQRIESKVAEAAQQQVRDHALEHGDEDTESLLALHGQAVLRVSDSSRHPRMKKFRFQLLHQWLSHNFPPCRAADVGGGKGLLSFLLQASGWQVTVIDPVPQPLPDKFKDITTGTRVRIPPTASVPHLDAPFDTGQASAFDFLIGMHAHGCNARIIDAAAHYGCGFVIFPCCVIDEPFFPPPGVHWLESLADYAIRQGVPIQPFRLNFKGQNIGLFYRGRPL